ncbi:hypothetical protein ACFOY2_15825 [Nonomuraea purpurea]|uniref:DUF5666 domain-containing protein n=1 Tax=Nonomuraea purpurea TaxID=1849276 RepID=A0ABV8G6P8_9ACTN
MAQLDSSPYPDDLREELAVQPRQGASKLTLTLAAGVVLVAGIIIGIQAANLSAPPAAAGPMGGGFAQRQGGQGQPQGQSPGQPFGQRGAGQRMGGGTVGTVEKVEDGKVYLKTMNGETVTVTTDDKTTVQVSKPGKVSDLKSGTTVVVRGRPGDDGSVTAASITQGAQGGMGGQGGTPR